MKYRKSTTYKSKDITTLQKKLDEKYGRGVYKSLVIICLASVLLISTGCPNNSPSPPPSTPSTHGTPIPKAPPSPVQQSALDAYIRTAGSSNCRTGATTGGDVILKRIKFKTDFDVCSDIVKSFSDDENFWILFDPTRKDRPIRNDEDKYFHWLKDRSTDPNEAKKPPVIPITFTSKVAIKFEATFEVVKDMPTDPKIWVEDNQPGNAFIFSKPSGIISKAKDEYTLSFESNIAYKDTVKYFEHFSLIFFNEADNNALVGMSCNRLYITYDKPFHDSFAGDVGGEDKTLEIFHKNNGTKENLLESLLYISCKYADGKKNDDDIVNAIFDHIDSLSVKRVKRLGVPNVDMGYWRDTSSAHTYSMAFRNGRVLLQSGNARCGEWSYFFRNLCEVQSIKGHKAFNIETSGGSHPTKTGFVSALFLVKTWKINDPKAPRDNGGRAQGSNSRTTDKPFNLFWDHAFVKYKNKYYDPSYGLKSTKSFGSDKDLLNDYTSYALTGVVYVKPDASGEQIQDIHHTGSAIDPLLKFGVSSPTGYIYHTETSSLADHLLIV